jgi:ParB/RepB/Spo0J family partition protein
LELPVDFAKKIADNLGWKIVQVQDTFEFSEDKQGFFLATLKPKKFLEKHQFQRICSLARDLGGEGYVKGAKAWKIPSAYAKKSWASVKCVSCGSSVSVYPDQKEVRCEKCGQMIQLASPASPAKPSEGPKKVSMETGFTTLPIRALLSMPFQSRITAEGPEFTLLVDSIKTYGVLEPIIVRPKPTGLFEIAAGDRRVRAAEKAGLLEVPVIIRKLSDEEALVICLTENLHRKDLSDLEKSRALGELAKTKGWNAHQIAEFLKMSYTWVVKYLPDEYKDSGMSELGKLGAESKKEQDLHVATRRVANGESEETRHTISCANCGDPVAEPVHLQGKFYCQECAEQVEAESIPTALPTEPVPSFDESPEGPEEVGESERSQALRAIQIGEFTCTECNQHFLVDHLPNGKHRLRLVKEVD